MRFTRFERKEIDFMIFSGSNLKDDFYKYADRFRLHTNELLRNGVEGYSFLRVDTRRRGIKDSRDPRFDAVCVIEG